MAVFQKPKIVGDLQHRLNSADTVISVSGMTSIASRSFVLSYLETPGKTHVIVTDTNASLAVWESDLSFWLRETGKVVIGLPSFETDVYSGASPHPDTMERRALALWQMSHAMPDVLIVSARSLAMRIPSAADIRDLGAVIAVDEDHPLEELIERLIAVGYVREDPVNNVGQFSARGGILDVWPPNAVLPLRIEFFGDTVDSIRIFDPETQLSTERLKKAEIAPMREFTVTAADMRDWAYFAPERFDGESQERALKDRTDFAGEGEPFSGWEYLLPLVKPLKGSLFDLVRDAIYFIDEPVQIEQTLGSIYDNLDRRYRSLAETGEIGLEPTELFWEGTTIREKLDGATRIEFRALGTAAASTDEEFAVNDNDAPQALITSATTHQASPLFLFPAAAAKAEIEILSRPTRNFHGDIAAFTKAIKPETDHAVVVQSHGIAERLDEMLRDYDATLVPERIITGMLSGGFEMPEADLVVYTETDVFGETVSAEGISSTPGQIKRPGKKARLGAFISDFRDLKPGDYVVHIDHGLGQFEGLQTISSQGSEREFMLLTYADKARLFVPVERLDLVSRYSSGEATSPTLERLGGLGWQKTKAKAKRSMRDMADELLKLYAERKLVTGYAFSPDAPWQHEFEDAFPFDLTVDQAKAIEDVKGDMESARPMDRLIIGDVGYGKTEVAMRAAFKAVMDGRQVAVLTPTTILAYQHFQSFRKRFAAFPAKIELLSRFRSSKEQKAVVNAAEESKVDVVVGTHRVLSNDVKLPKLGLVIVDEEQRFGVAHKEKLKQLKKKVDVLTLSATPIPRTLNMSLLGMRDMSVIETPPRDRLAINTQVVQFSENIIRSAIDLELSRNGQVFFIHNRVETIETIAAHVQKIVPEARIAIGHGKMNEKEMEQVMLDFIDYKYDVLIATTIIENGIDIPRANTIIINRADNYGLSQLYQLRGRVGRSNRRAYAYLLIPGEIELTPIARRRLSAMREFSDLGAGFRIAALDLELRGAGNILSGQQSGHLDALGFDLYTKMLERTIAELRGEEIADEISVSINLGVDVSIPKDYISETGQRLRTYKRISSASAEDEMMQIHSEIEDRYGKMPDSVENLFAYGRLRRLAESVGVLSIDRVGETIAIKLSDGARVSPDAVMELLSSNDKINFSPGGILRIPVDNENIILTATDLLDTIRLP